MSDDARPLSAEEEAFLAATFDNEWMLRPVEECRAALRRLLDAARSPEPGLDGLREVLSVWDNGGDVGIQTAIEAIRRTVLAARSPEPGLREAALLGLAAKWDRDADEREDRPGYRAEAANLLAAGITRTHADQLRATLAARSPEPTDYERPKALRSTEAEGLDVERLAEALRSDAVGRFVMEAWVETGVSEPGYATPDEMAAAIATEYARLGADR